MEGSNVDDDGDYRPGMQAIRELGILSPLQEASLTKAEIQKAGFAYVTLDLRGYRMGSMNETSAD